jgi:superfamily II DNA or RNA helicase
MSQAVGAGAGGRIRGVRDSDDLDIAIAQEVARLDELDQLRLEVQGRIERLRADRVLSPTVRPSRDAELTAEFKLSVFAGLFRGREDVFPVRWEKGDRTRSGWSPSCRNEWKPGVCGKPTVKCGECPNQAFRAPDRTELLAHLQGRQVMGVYPVLADDTCWLLTIDLDRHSWGEDVEAIRDACRELDVVAAVERSRSGAGAHVWFFFEEPVPAALARRFGLMVLTAAMARCPTLTMASYDRLFPSQDTLPKGGFGNLVALPLQREARDLGNTLFVDAHGESVEDQWVYLSSLPRIGRELLERLVAAGERDGTILGVPEAPDDTRDSRPWRSRRSLADRLAATPLPNRVSAMLADRVYVQLEGLPAVLVDAVRRLAVFSNPLFLEKQRMRFSTARIPRVIACFEETGGYLALPRGCREPLSELLAGLGVQLDLIDERTDGGVLDTTFTGTLTPPQIEAAEAMLAHDLGVLCAPPGIGKTVIATSLIATRGRSTLVLVSRQPLAEQWARRLTEFLDLNPRLIGTIGAGKRQPTGIADIAMVQSLARCDDLSELLSGYGHIVIDECHHVPAVTTEQILRAAPARYVTGLTATPHRRDGHHPIMTMQCGPVRHMIGSQASASTRGLTLRVVRRDTRFDPSTLPTDPSIQEVYGALADDEQRTDLIARDALELAAQGRSLIVLTERRDHLDRLTTRLLDRLTTRLPDQVPALVTLHGDMSPKARRAAIQQLAETPAGEARIVLATGRYIGEGFDDPRLDTLLLAMPIAWKGTVVQYAGRLHRNYPGKRAATVYDYVDADLPVLRRMFAKRLKAYRTLGYELAPSA